MKAARLPLLAGLCCLLSLAGCTTTWRGLQNMVTSPVEYYRQNALAHEKQGQLQEALFDWRIVDRLDGDNSRTPQIIQKLQRAIHNAAQFHFRRGLDYYQKGDYINARREFLICLRVQPDHTKALYYLKSRLHSTDQADYKVQRGDSFIRIAQQVYHDSTKADAIAYFNGLDPQKPLFINTVLLLPDIAPKYLVPPKEIIRLLENAERALENKHFHKVLELTDKIKSESPGNKKAQALSDAAHFSIGTGMLEKGRFLEALAELKLVSASYKGRNKALQQARSSLHREALADKLALAQKHLNNHDYASAINVVEDILSQDPNNASAKKLFTAAHYALGKQLIEKNEDAMALETLNAIDASYQDTAQLRSMARARLNAQAESYYRAGVKHFLNEELEAAINSWKKALSLNPKHPKAGQDIENAQRLLEKWRDLDQDDQPEGNK